MTVIDITERRNDSCLVAPSIPRLRFVFEPDETHRVGDPRLEE